MNIIELYKLYRKTGKALNEKILSSLPKERDHLFDAIAKLGISYEENKIILENKNEKSRR